MSWYRIVPIIALLFWLSPLAGCNKKKTPPPKELASLTPDQACKHFFGRVKTCSATINRIKADKLGLEGPRREVFLRQVGQQVKRAFSDLDRLCERYALKTRKQQTDMDRCYRERTCEAFGQCFVHMADAEMPGPGGKGAGNLEELRKQLRELKSTRLRRLKPKPRPKDTSHGHMHRPKPKAKTKPRPAPQTTPEPMLKTKP